MVVYNYEVCRFTLLLLNNYPFTLAIKGVLFILYVWFFFKTEHMTGMLIYVVPVEMLQLMDAW